MNVRYILVSVRMTPAQFAALAKKAALKGVFLAYAGGVVQVPTKIGVPLANAYARRIAEVDRQLNAN
jgi:hypothetical protein